MRNEGKDPNEGRDEEEKEEFGRLSSEWEIGKESIRERGGGKNRHRRMALKRDARNRVLWFKRVEVEQDCYYCCCCYCVLSVYRHRRSSLSRKR